MQDIKYQYAINSSGKTVNATNLIASIEVRSETYKCLSCENFLIPVLGEKRKKHFRHKADIQIQCSLETYLHKLGKIRFYDVYNSCLAKKIPFLIEITFTQRCNFQKESQYICTFRQGKQRFDITQYFKSIKLEKKDECFVPDLLLISDKGEKIYIEVAVTHKSTQEKIDSGHRIIELTINCESDINILDRRLLSESNKVEFFNFKREQTKNFCSGQCVEKINFKKTINGKSNRNDILRKQLVTSQFKENCFLCHHHAINTHSAVDTPIYCRVRKKTCNPHVAKNCKHYQPDIELSQM